MTVSTKTQAILLLTAHFGKDDSGAYKPLTPREYGRFAEWLRSHALMPEQLLSGNPGELLKDWHDKYVSVERITALLERGSALALSMEKWLRAGLWVMTRSDADYPKRLKQRLRGDSPAVLFGSGNRALLNAGGLAVVGSRKVQQSDLTYSGKIGEMAASAGISIVSGGAKGVDETAMLGALGAEGTAVGVLADSLLRACYSAKYRHALMDNNLVLVSPFNPEAGFNAGNAMQRNKYIYCLADAALAVHSGKKGGTWSGAQEDLKKEWVPLWVKRTNDPEAGNGELIAAGALEAPAMIGEVEIDAFFRADGRRLNTLQGLFNHSVAGVKESTPAEDVEEDSATATKVNDTGEKIQIVSETRDEDAATINRESSVFQAIDLSQVTFYEHFLAKVRIMCADKSCTTEELIEALGVNKSQANAWLKQAVKDGELKKLARPVRYEAISTRQGKLPLK